MGFCMARRMCTGSILMNRVHDHTVDLTQEVDTALDRYVVEAAGLMDDVKALRECELSPAAASEILLQAARTRLVGWAAIGRVDAEYRRPTFAEHGRDNSWALLNAFTYAARRNINPIRQMEAYDAFRAMLPTVTGLN